jgi:hypothetical protein
MASVIARLDLHSIAVRSKEEIHNEAEAVLHLKRSPLLRTTSVVLHQLATSWPGMSRPEWQFHLKELAEQHYIIDTV